MKQRFFQNLYLLANRSHARGRLGTNGAIRLRLCILRRASLRKILNFFSIKIQKKLKVQRVWGLPYRYKVDPTNVCQLHCPLCPTGLKHDFRSKGFLDESKYKNFVDQIAGSAIMLDLFGWGEPVLHPQIASIISYASQQGVFVRLSTTLHGMGSMGLEKLVGSGLDAMIVAVDGSDDATHQKIRAGGDLSQVLDSLKELVELKQAMGKRLPHITVRMLVNRTNEHQISAVKTMVQDLGVDAFTVGSVAINTQDASQAEEWLPKESRISAYAGTLKNQGSCEDLWEAMVVNWEGGVAPCCWEYHHENDVGNAFEKPVSEIWNGPAMLEARRIVSGRAVVGHKVSSVCQRCQGAPNYLE